MAVQQASTRQIALEELARLDHLIETTDTVEIRFPYNSDETSHSENRRQVASEPTSASIAADSHPISIDQLRQMEQHLNNKFDTQYQHMWEIHAEIQRLRHLLTLNAVLLCGLWMWMWQ